jgi:hypothetical protein
MKTTDKSAQTKRNFDQLISKFSENEILTVQAMSYVKGGGSDGDGTGSEPIIIIPKPR